MRFFLLRILLILYSHVSRNIGNFFIGFMLPLRSSDDKVCLICCRSRSRDRDRYSRDRYSRSRSRDKKRSRSRDRKRSGSYEKSSRLVYSIYCNTVSVQIHRPEQIEYGM